MFTDRNVAAVMSVRGGWGCARILPYHDFAAHARAIAYNLDMAEVQVVALGPSLIRLDLLPKTGLGVGEAA